MEGAGQPVSPNITPEADDIIPLQRVSPMKTCGIFQSLMLSLGLAG